MGYAYFNLKARAGSIDPDQRYKAGDLKFLPSVMRGANKFNKPAGVKAARNFLKLLKGKSVKIDRVSFSKLVINYN